MRKSIFRRIHALYGEDLPVIIQKRTELELERIDELEMEDQLMAVRDLSIGLHEADIPFSVAGEAAASFLLYLLDVSQVNPLPPHYYCPSCRKIEFSDEAPDGYDLPPKKCSSCGREMMRDGHDMPLELFWGLRGPGGIEPTPRIAMRLPRSGYEQVKEFLGTYPLLASLEKSEGRNGIGYRCGSLFIAASMALPEKDEFWFKPVEAGDIRRYELENYRGILKIDPETKVTPNSFFGVLRLYGLTRSSWSRINNQMTVVRADGSEETVYTLDDFGYSIDVVPAFFDDVFNVLLKENVPPAQAYWEFDTTTEHKTYTLAPDSKLYVIPFPEDARKKNPNLTNNE